MKTMHKKKDVELRFRISEVPIEQRAQIVEDIEAGVKPAVIRATHHLTSKVLGHIKFQHGRMSRAGELGRYYKELPRPKVQEKVSPNAGVKKCQYEYCNERTFTRKSRYCSIHKP